MKTHQVATYLSDEEYKALMEYINKKTNGYHLEMSKFLRAEILKLIQYNTQPLSTPSPKPAVAPNVESSQHLNLSDLDW
jgi:hypothetical protein